MKIHIKYWVLSLLWLGLLVGCGQKGDLYLPDTDTAQKESVTIDSKNAQTLKKVAEKATKKKEITK